MSDMAQLCILVADAMPGMTPDAVLEMPLAQALQFRSWGLAKRGAVIRPPGGSSDRRRLREILGEEGLAYFAG